MSESLIETILAAVVFAVLLGLERRYPATSLRVGTATLALIVLLLAQPNYTAAARRISVAPREHRITELHGEAISDYESGVATMYTAIGEVGEQYALLRLLALGVVFWLACAPALPRSRHRGTDQ